MIDLNAFADELEKISNGAAAAAGAIRHKIPELYGAVKAHPNLIKYPLIGAGSIAAWEALRRAKRRYDIGQAYEEAQGA